MKPGALMIMGVVAGLVASAGAIFDAETPSTVVMAFAAGAVFGKGYGIWEERERAGRSALRKEERG